MKKTSVVAVATLALCAVWSGFASGEASDSLQSCPITIVRADFDGALDVWFIQLINERWTWDVIASTEGWAEFDLGVNTARRGWYLQALGGIDFAKEDSVVTAASFIPQLYALRYERTHAELWLVGHLPFHDKGTSLTTKALAARRFKRFPLGLGGQHDGVIKRDAFPTHFFGPLIEYYPLSAMRVSGTVQWSLDHSRSSPSQFLLAVQTWF